MASICLPGVQEGAEQVQKGADELERNLAEGAEQLQQGADELDRNATEVRQELEQNLEEAADAAADTVADVASQAQAAAQGVADSASSYINSLQSESLCIWTLSLLLAYVVCKDLCVQLGPCDHLSMSLRDIE